MQVYLQNLKNCTYICWDGNLDERDLQFNLNDGNIDSMSQVLHK